MFSLNRDQLYQRLADAKTHIVRTGQRIRVTSLVDVTMTDPAVDVVLQEATEWRGPGPFPRQSEIDALPRGPSVAGPHLTCIKVPKVVTPAGTVYEGIVTDTDSAWGFFDLNMDDGEAITFTTIDPDIRIDEIG